MYLYEIVRFVEITSLDRGGVRIEDLLIVEFVTTSFIRQVYFVLDVSEVHVACS